MEAVGYCNPECVERLLSAGADVDGADQYGRTVLMGSIVYLASGFDQVRAKQCFGMLLNAGCDLDARDSLGDTARDYALERDLSGVVELIEAEGERRALDATVVRPGVAPIGRRI
jgi:ankyrin repeat protein